MSAKEQIKQLVDYFKREPLLKDKTDSMGDGLLLGASLADDANELSKDVQAQVDQLVVAGDSSVEAAQARVDASGKAYTTLKKRLDEKEQETTAQFQHTADRFKIKKVEPVWTWTLDDSQIEDFTVMLPMLERKGVKATFGVISDNVGKVGFTNESQLLEIQNKGHEIASHGKAHESRYPDITDGALDIELRVSKESLIDRGFNVKNMLTPFGNTDERVMNAQSKYYRSARVSGIGALGELNKTPINTFRTTSILIGDTSGIGNGVDPVSGKEFDTLGYWKYWLDKAIETNSWIVFIGHSYMINRNNRMGELEQLIDYAQSKGDAIKNLTYDKALDIFENKVETSGMKIGADGRISGMYGKTKLGKGNEVTGLTPLDSIEGEMITFNAVYDGGGTGMPRNVGGTMVTFKSDNLGVRSFQLVKSSHVDDYDQLYLRTFNAAKEPSDFFKLNNLSIIKNIPFAHTPGTLKDRVITYSYIDNANASGYPENTGGLLIAHLVADDWGSCSETYKIRNTDRFYTRSWNAVTSSWTDFKEVLTSTKITYDVVNFNTPMTDFPRGTSYCQITGGKALFPETTQGLLETLNYAGKGYQYQIYHLYNVTTAYKRVWKSDGTYSAFVKIND